MHWVPQVTVVHDKVSVRRNYVLRLFGPLDGILGWCVTNIRLLNGCVCPFVQAAEVCPLSPADARPQSHQGLQEGLFSDNLSFLRHFMATYLSLFTNLWLP